MMNSMDDWNQRHHGRSGLIERVKNSKITESVAEEQTIEFLQRAYWRKHLADVWEQHLPGSSVLGQIHADA
jgi:oligoribonuclease (3'-5' exoribonuclease)